MMSTFLCLTVPEGWKEERIMVNEEVVKFKYPEVVADNYRYRGEVDNQNDLKHDYRNKPQFGFESKWGTTWWPIRVFAFFMECTEVNAYPVMTYFLNTDNKFMYFRKKWTKVLNNNSYTNEKTCGSPGNFIKRQLSHTLETAPTHATE